MQWVRYVPGAGELSQHSSMLSGQEGCVFACPMCFRTFLFWLRILGFKAIVSLSQAVFLNTFNIVSDCKIINIYYFPFSILFSNCIFYQINAALVRIRGNHLLFL